MRALLAVDPVGAGILESSRSVLWKMLVPTSWKVDRLRWRQWLRKVGRVQVELGVTSYGTGRASTRDHVGGGFSL